MALERVVIVHGYHADPSSHWFPWLSERLSREGVRVQIPALPDPTDPDPERWIAAASDVIGTPDRGLGIVAHSLGAVTALHALGRLDGDWSLGAFVAVSGFVAALPGLPGLDAFTAGVPDLARVTARTRERTVVVSDDDTIVAPGLTVVLGELLDAGVVTIPGGGHFLAEDGYTTFPAFLPSLGHAASR